VDSCGSSLFFKMPICEASDWPVPAIDPRFQAHAQYFRARAGTGCTCLGIFSLDSAWVMAILHEYHIIKVLVRKIIFSATQKTIICDVVLAWVITILHEYHIRKILVRERVFSATQKTIICDVVFLSRVLFLSPSSSRQWVFLLCLFRALTIDYAQDYWVAG
jgi:hypothetical protein